MHHHNHGLGPLLLIGAIAFVFGERVARGIVGTVLLAGLGFFAYVAWRVVMGTL